jgi:glyoxylase-like metal-dependent hydrolase (beta-lactamase superfamily II)
MTDNSFYFKQLLSGSDFAESNLVARQMVNFVYALGDLDSRQCILVDPTYDVDSLIETIQKDDMNISGVLLTHYHADHAGGDLFGHKIEGSKELLEKLNIPIHCNENEVEWILKGTSLDKNSLVPHSSGDSVSIGKHSIKLIHTPGHTPGSQCFLISNILISGDTLFLNGCGRTDLPGSDPELMYDSLVNKLNKLEDSTVVFPGHYYSNEPFDTLDNIKTYNPVLKPKSAAQWLSIFG